MIGAGRWQACRRVHGHLYLLRPAEAEQNPSRSPVGNDLVSQGCPKDDPAVRGRPLGMPRLHLCEQAWLRLHPRGVSESFTCQRVPQPELRSRMPFAIARRGMVRKPPSLSTHAKDQNRRWERLFWDGRGQTTPREGRIGPASGKTGLDQRLKPDRSFHPPGRPASPFREANQDIPPDSGPGVDESSTSGPAPRGWTSRTAA